MQNLGKRCVIFASLLGLSVGFAQTGLTVASFGYRNPGKSIVAAPGQVLNVSIFGVSTRLAAPITPVASAGGFPTEIQGVSAEFSQGATTVVLPLWALQQTPCPATGTCLPATTLTLQIPYDLVTGSADAAVLKIRENRAMVAEVAINAVPDRVHIMNTCDETFIWVGVANDVPAGTCVPIVAHANAQLVTAANPARAGETLIIWAFGLGALDRPVPPVCCATPEELPQAAQPLTIGLSYASSGRASLRRLASLAPVYAGGIYLSQVHFVVPAAPADLAACSATSGNLKVLLSGPGSADSAEICLR